MKRKTLLLTTALAVTFLAGCYGSGVDRNWGRSARVNYSAQVRNPEAPADLEQRGLDAQTSSQAMAGHRQRTAEKVSQQEPPSVINIGTGIGED